MSNHSSLPWSVVNDGLNHKGEPYPKQILDADQTTIARVWHCDIRHREHDLPNAAFIVRAVNNHAALLQACDDLLRVVEVYPPTAGHKAQEAVARAITEARKAIAEAMGGPS
jgi:hypothetical protein